MDQDFFYHYLSSSAFQARLKEVASRSAQDGFSKEDISGFPVPVPPLQNQRDIMNKIGPLSAKTLQLDGIYQKKLAALGALRNSFLHQAFSGQL